MRDALVIGISQSGRSPDIVAVLDEARSQGALTVALVNAPESPLADAADAVIDLACRPGARHGRDQELHRRAARRGAAVGGARRAKRCRDGRPGRACPISSPLPSRQRMRRAPSAPATPTGRTASSWAAATPTPRRASGRSSCRSSPRCWSSRIRRPISSTVRSRWPNPVSRSWPWRRRAWRSRASSKCSAGCGTNSVCACWSSATPPTARALDEGLRLPAGIPGWLSPVVEIVPGQLYAYHLTVARGLDPDRPRTIGKVTETS